MDLNELFDAQSSLKRSESADVGSEADYGCVPKEQNSLQDNQPPTSKTNEVRCEVAGQLRASERFSKDSSVCVLRVLTNTKQTIESLSSTATIRRLKVDSAKGALSPYSARPLPRSPRAIPPQHPAHQPPTLAEKVNELLPTRLHTRYPKTVYCQIGRTHGAVSHGVDAVSRFGSDFRRQVR